MTITDVWGLVILKNPNVLIYSETDHSWIHG